MLNIVMVVIIYFVPLYCLFTHVHSDYDFHDNKLFNAYVWINFLFC